MTKLFWILVLSCFFFLQKIQAQHLYYKTVNTDLVWQFRDSARRVLNIDSNSILRKQFDYVLKFYPKMRVKNIIVSYKASSKIVKTKPKFGSIFKLPGQRIYTITFSKKTNTTLDSILLGNLSFNSQVGLIANQISTIEDMSTGGFFNFVGWYFKQLSGKSKRKLITESELKTLEVGLGHQLLSLNKECQEKLVIDKWTTTKGYTNYMRHYRTQNMKPQKINNFMSDMPVYVSNSFK